MPRQGISDAKILSESSIRTKLRALESRQNDESIERRPGKHGRPSSTKSRGSDMSFACNTARRDSRIRVPIAVAMVLVQCGSVEASRRVDVYLGGVVSDSSRSLQARDSSATAVGYVTGL
jgi:hypothetical protein